LTDAASFSEAPGLFSRLARYMAELTLPRVVLERPS
jgi:hypothetical protein